MHEARIARLREVYDANISSIIRIVSANGATVRQKKEIYACLNSVCQVSASLYSEILETPQSYDLLEQAAEIDRCWLQLRKYVGSTMATRIAKVA